MIKYTIDISFLQVHEIMFLRLRVTGQASVTLFSQLLIT